MKKVIKFYKDLPFNFTDDISFFVNNIKRANQVLEYEDLHKILVKKKYFLVKPLIRDVIEFGCGTGWLSNTLAYYYNKKVTSVDFTEKALNVAKAVSLELNKSVDYNYCNIFDYENKKQFDLVISLGVLHHTYDCKEAFNKISKFVKPGGFLYVGLYHLYGRKPMLQFLQSYYNWHGEESAYKLFKKMTQSTSNDMHSYSWFRDQVLHPHETQHTFEELNNWINEINFKIVSTSINKYKNISRYRTEDLLKIEKTYENISYEQNVNKLKFMPGFFTLCAKRNQ